VFTWTACGTRTGDALERLFIVGSVHARNGGWRARVSGYYPLTPSLDLPARAEEEAGGARTCAPPARCVALAPMTWPPPELRPGWDYELYNDALIERLEEHDWWNAYTAARDSARANQTELPDYPTVAVLEVQKALNEVATAAMLAQHLARVRLVANATDREEAATGVGKRSAAGQSEADPEEEEVDDYSPVDPDYLVSAFAAIFEEVWGPIRDTLVALRGVASNHAPVFMDEVTSKACVNGTYASDSDQHQSRCAALNGGYWPSVRAYNRACREGWLRVQRCAWPRRHPHDGLCIGHIGYGSGPRPSQSSV